MIYRNIKNGATIETESLISGENWEPVNPAPAPVPVKEKVEKPKPIKKK